MPPSDVHFGSSGGLCRHGVHLGVFDGGGCPVGLPSVTAGVFLVYGPFRVVPVVGVSYVIGPL